MPLIAIAVAVVADVAAGTALAAGTLGTFAAIGAVGATISAIGAVTGNKALSTAGMVLGGIGGIGSLASAAGIISDPSVTSFFGSDAATVAAPDIAGDAAASTSDLSGLSNTSGIDLGNGASGDFVNNISSSVGISGNPVDAAAIGGATPPPMSSPADITGNTGTETGSTVGNNLDYANPSGDPTQPVTPTNPVTPGNASGANTPVGQAPVGTVQAPTIAAPTAPELGIPSAPRDPFAAPVIASDASGTSGLLGFLGKGNNAGLLGMGAIQAVGSFISGATNPLTPAQVALAQSQAAQNNAAAKLQQTQNTNMAQPVPTATRTASNVGLINTPANTNTVTAQGNG